MTVSQLLANTTSYELTEWMAEFMIEMKDHKDKQEQQNVEADLTKVFGKQDW